MWQFRFTGEELEAFIPSTGFFVVGFDAARPAGGRLYLIGHFAELADAEAEMDRKAGVPCFVSCSGRRARQLSLFDEVQRRRPAIHEVA